MFQYTATKTIKTIAPNKKIVTFDNGLEAIQFFKSNLHDFSLLPSVIFVDINMPYLDGWGFAEEYNKLLQHARNNIKIYIVSSSVSDLDRKRTEAIESIQGFISKPVGVDDYFRIVSQSLN